MSREPCYRRIGFRITASVALLLICMSLVNPDELARALIHINLYYLTVALLLNIVGSVLAKAWIAHLTTRASGLSLGFAELIRINLIARFYTIALPRGASAAIRWHHYRKGGSGHAAAALLIFESMVSIFTLFLSTAVILSFEYKQAGTSAQLLLPLAWLGTLVATLMLLPFMHQRSAKVFLHLLQPLLKRPGSLAELINKLLSAIKNYHEIPVRRVGTIFLVSLFGHVFFILSAWMLAEGMTLGLSLAAIAWVRSATLLVALIPITVAGLGLRESALIALLSDYNISASTAFAYAIASFAIQLVLGLIGAILEVQRILINKKKTPVNGFDRETS